MPTEHISAIPMARLRESPSNPRQTFDPAALSELAASIRSQGLLQPIVVRPHLPDLRSQPAPEDGFEIVFGHRRFRAAQMAEMAEMPCIIRAMSDAEVDAAQLHENLERADVSPLEEAESYARLMRHHGTTVDQLAADTGKSRTYIYNRLKLIALTDTARQAVVKHGIGPEIATLIARVPAQLQPKAIDAVLSTDYDTQAKQVVSFRAARLALQRDFTIRILHADGTSAVGFDPADECLSTSGACTTCPKLSSNDPGLVDALGAGVCTDVPCHAEKLKAFDYARWSVARVAGRVIEGFSADVIASATPRKPPKGYVFLSDQCYPAQAGTFGPGSAHYTYRAAMGKLAEYDRCTPDDHIIIIEHHGKLIQFITDTSAAIISHDLRALLEAAQPSGGEGDNSKAEASSSSQAGQQGSAAPMCTGAAVRSGKTAWTDKERAVADQALWAKTSLALMQRIAAGERTHDDLQLLARREIIHVGTDCTVIAQVLGWWAPTDSGAEGGASVKDAMLDHIDHKASGADLAKLLLMMAAQDLSDSAAYSQSSAATLVDLAARYGVDVLNPEGKGSQQSDEAGPAGQAHDPERCPNTADLFRAA